MQHLRFELPQNIVNISSCLCSARPIEDDVQCFELKTLSFGHESITLSQVLIHNEGGKELADKNVGNQPITHHPQYHMKAPKGVKAVLKLGKVMAITKLNSQLMEVTNPMPVVKLCGQGLPGEMHTTQTSD